MNFNKYFVNTLFDIFGYSVVGILSYIFGLTLQNYNINGTLFSLFFKHSQLIPQLSTMIIIQVLLICLFGHSYAISILPRTEIQHSSNVYEVVGNWLETLFVFIIIFVGMYALYNPNTFCGGFWISTGLSIAIYTINCIYYRVKVRSKEFNKNNFHVLFIPAFLMVGVNIYLGSSVSSFLNNDWWFYVPLVIFILYYLLICCCEGKSLIVHIFFFITIIILGIMTLLNNSEDITLPLRNLFLSIMVSLFLSIFEGWYVIFRKLSGVNNEKLSNIIMQLIIYSPPVVCVLYPIQKFNFVYLVSFFLGILVTQFIWLFYVYPSKNLKNEDDIFKKKKKATAVWRASLGILTLSFLMLDKYLILETPLWELKGEFILVGLLSFETILGLIIKYVSRLLTEIDETNKYMSNFFKSRFIVYIFSLCILFLEQGYLKDMSKVNASVFFIFAISLVELGVLSIYYAGGKRKLWKL